MTNDVNDDQPAYKTPDELLKEALGEEDYDEDEEAAQILRDEKRRDEARIAAEASTNYAPVDNNALPGLLPVGYATMSGFGKEGPNYVFIPVWEVKKNRDGSDVTDDDGDPVYILKRKKLKIAPYLNKDMADASLSIAGVHDTTFQCALVWSFQDGEGDLVADDVAARLESLYPKTYKDPKTGEMVERPPFNPYDIAQMFNGHIKDINEDNTIALEEAVTLALQRFQPDLTQKWVSENCEAGLLTRILGKILWLNGGMRDRFLA